MGLKIGIVGLAPRRRPDFTICDEYYGLPWDPRYLYQFDYLFEPHKDIEFPQEYFDRVNESEIPVYTEVKGFDYRLDYPELPTDYFESSPAYMMALAMTKADEIHIWGVEMDMGSEYAYQRANFEYLIGMARGMGIKVVIYDSPLCTHCGHIFRGKYGVGRPKLPIRHAINDGLY